MTSQFRCGCPRTEDNTKYVTRPDRVNVTCKTCSRATRRKWYAKQSASERHEQNRRYRMRAIYAAALKKVAWAETEIRRLGMTDLLGG